MRTTTFGRWAPILVLGLLLPLLLSPGSSASQRAVAVTVGVSGSAVDAHGNPVPDVRVRAEQLRAGGWRNVGETVTEVDGEYAMDLEPGTYRLRFEPRYVANLADEYWGGVYVNFSLREAPATFVVEEGAVVTEKDVVLEALSTIAGRVRTSVASSETRPHASLVRKFNGEWFSVLGSSYDSEMADGRYLIERVVPGTYRVFLSRGNGFIGKYWPGAGTVEAALDLTVAAGSSVEGIDGLLAPYGEIAGRLVNAAGQGIPNFHVEAEGEDINIAGRHRATTSTDSQGYYKLTALVPARYTLSFGRLSAPCDSKVYSEEGDGTPDEIVIPKGSQTTITVAVEQQILTCDLEPTEELQPFGFDPAQFDKPAGVVPPEFDVPGVDISYQWFRIGFPITGATSFWYVPVFADVPHSLTLQVRASRPGFNPMVWQFESFVYPGTIRRKVPPRIKGAPEVGSTLRVTRGEWTPADVKIHRYQWLSDGVPIRGAKGRRLAVTRKYLDRRISVRFVVYTANGSYMAREFQTKPTKPVTRR
jgi:hypothetical protein